MSEGGPFHEKKKKKKKKNVVGTPINPSSAQKGQAEKGGAVSKFFRALGERKKGLFGEKGNSSFSQKKKGGGLFTRKGGRENKWVESKMKEKEPYINAIKKKKTDEMQNTARPPPKKEKSHRRGQQGSPDRSRWYGPGTRSPVAASGSWQKIHGSNQDICTGGEKKKKNVP